MQGGGIYADYNDLLDECKKSSIAIGMKKPQSIPAGPAGIQNVLFTIIAPRGNDSSGPISGTVQSVDSTWCDLNVLMSLTDCMGVTAGSDGERLTLNRDNKWTAPNRCWDSYGQGLVKPISIAC
jgi:hypothetical protein